MEYNIFKSIFGLLMVCSLVAGIDVYRVCAGDGTAEMCSQMSRGSSEVQCTWAQDNIECTKKILNGTADFGMFTAESILHVAVLDYPDLAVIQPFAHKEREYALFDFASVVIVRKDHQNGLEGLRGKKYCHPGFDYNPNEKWSERFFKTFERRVTQPKCEKDKSAAELETAALSQYFNDSCRPGIWSYDPHEDKELKKKYSSLCKLCPKKDCKYTDTPEIEKNHQFAMKCLQDGGDVAYVSLEEAKTYFRNKDDMNPTDYQYLCKDGTALPIETSLPCTWLRQPWKAVITRTNKDIEIRNKLKEWMRISLENNSWHMYLRKILKVEDFRHVNDATIQIPKDYMRYYREIPQDETLCNTLISWCTVSDLEHQKCEIARAGGISTGLYPQIKCRSPVDSTVQCLEDISRNDTDFMGIDSNYGWLARSKYNLTSALFFDTEIEQFSTIVVVTKENSAIENFTSLRDKKGCMPEYGSSTAVAFINELKDRKIFDREECNYGKLLNEYLGESCLPGAQDWKYVQTKDSEFTSLCTLCFKGQQNGNGNGDLNVQIDTQNSSKNSVQPSWRTATISNCAANPSNRYFGNRGSLKCLSEVGDFAVLELQSLKVHAEEIKTNENLYKILCKNNTLAKHSGFDVDLNCALTTVVDGEIVMYRKSPKTSSVVHVLQALEHYFIRKNDPSFKIYNIFESERNILFKDSTVGLTHPNSENQGQMVENYKKLFKDVEKCSGNSADSMSINIILTTFLISFRLLLN